MVCVKVGRVVASDCRDRILNPFNGKFSYHQLYTKNCVLIRQKLKKKGPGLAQFKNNSRSNFLKIIFDNFLKQVRICRQLRRQKMEGSATAINRLFHTHIWINSIFYPVLLAYLTSNLFVFPMANVVGQAGCLILVQFLDVFIRSFFF